MYRSYARFFQQRIAPVLWGSRATSQVKSTFSGGKDSICVLECGIIAARETGRLPVEVVMRDEELGWPDHYEYCERVAARPEVRPRPAQQS